MWYDCFADGDVRAGTPIGATHQGSSDKNQCWRPRPKDTDGCAFMPMRVAVVSCKAPRGTPWCRIHSHSSPVVFALGRLAFHGILGGDHWCTIIGIAAAFRDREHAQRSRETRVHRPDRRETLQTSPPGAMAPNRRCPIAKQPCMIHKRPLSSQYIADRK